jgi:hypothetical protein
MVKMNIKKGYFALLAACFLMMQNDVSAQVVNQGMDEDIPLAVNKGDVLITGFASYPNWGRYLANVAINSSEVDNPSTGGFAPLGAQVEFMLSDIFGFTIDGIFNQWNANWDTDGFDVNGDPIVYNNSVTVNRTRIMVGLNYHLDDIKNEQLNLYGGFALGFNDRRINLNVEDQNFSSFWGSAIDLPLAGRARLGMRYFLTESIGLNLELGVGGPILRGGLTFKFPS